VNQRTALVVDDDRALLALATRILVVDGFEVVAAPSAEAALAAAVAVPVLDLLFTDVVLPGDSGLALAAALRLERPTLPVLVTTGQWEGEVREAIKRAGHHLIRKPYDAPSVRRAVHLAIAAPDPGPVGVR